MRYWPHRLPPPIASPLTPDERLARLERGLVLLRDHVDRTMAELLAEVNRIEDDPRRSPAA